MKKFILFLLLVSSFAYSQTIYVPSKITFKNGKELFAKILFQKNPFHQGLLDENGVTDVYVKTGEEGERYVKHITTGIQRVEFVDLNGQQRVFKWLTDYRNLVEVKFQGKISWYRLYSKSEVNGDTQMTDYLEKGAGNRIVLSLLSPNKNNLEQFTSDKPALVPLIEKITYPNFKDEELLAILTKYNG